MFFPIQNFQGLHLNYDICAKQKCSVHKNLLSNHFFASPIKGFPNLHKSSALSQISVHRNLVMFANFHFCSSYLFLSGDTCRFHPSYLLVRLSSYQIQFVWFYPYSWAWPSHTHTITISNNPCWWSLPCNCLHWLSHYTMLLLLLSLSHSRNL